MVWFIGGLLLIVFLTWPKLKKLLPAAWAGKATQLIDAGADTAGDLAASAAFQALAVDGWLNGEGQAGLMVYLAKLDECRTLRAAWVASVVPPIPPPAPTVESLQAELAALQAIQAKVPA